MYKQNKHQTDRKQIADITTLELPSDDIYITHIYINVQISVSKRFIKTFRSHLLMHFYSIHTTRKQIIALTRVSIKTQPYLYVCVWKAPESQRKTVQNTDAHAHTHTSLNAIHITSLPSPVIHQWKVDSCVYRLWPHLKSTNCMQTLRTVRARINTC